MIDSIFKKYFNTAINDLEARQHRVWLKVSRHINVEVPAFNTEVRRNFAWLPLAASLAMVILGGVMINVFQNSLPGQRLYSVKRAVEEAQLKLASNPVSLEELQIELIEKRTQELVKLEEKAASDGELTASEVEKIDQVKVAVGKTAIAFVVSKQKTETAPPAPPEGTATPKQPPTETVKKPVSLDIISIAEAKLVGEAVTQLLKSGDTKLVSKADLLTKEVETVIKQSQDTKAASETGEVEGAKTSTGSKVQVPVPAPTPAVQPEEKPISTIKGEVESEEVEVK